MLNIVLCLIAVAILSKTKEELIHYEWHQLPLEKELNLPICDRLEFFKVIYEISIQKFWNQKSIIKMLLVIA